MSRFTTALRRVMGAVFAEFDTDEELNEWLSRQKSPTPEDETSLNAVLKNLKTGWVSNLLVNEDQSEESSVIAEAVILAMRNYAEDETTRNEFAYRLTSLILNKGVRPLNLSSREAPPEMALLEEPLHKTIDPLKMSPEEREHIDKIVASFLEKRQPKNQVADGKTVMEVMHAWLPAIKAVEAKHGRAQAKPSSSAVKQEIADTTGLALNVVEAAMARLKRALHKATEEQGQETMYEWISETLFSGPANKGDS